MSDAVTILTAQEFWRVMCDPGFIRTSRLSGRNRGTVYLTLEAPEDVPGFMEEKTLDVVALLTDEKRLSEFRRLAGL